MGLLSSTVNTMLQTTGPKLLPTTCSQVLYASPVVSTVLWQSHSAQPVDKGNSLGPAPGSISCVSGSNIQKVMIF